MATMALHTFHAHRAWIHEVETFGLPGPTKHDYVDNSLHNLLSMHAKKDQIVPQECRVKDMFIS